MIETLIENLVVNCNIELNKVLSIKGSCQPHRYIL